MKRKYTIAETFVGSGGSHIGFDQAGFTSIYVNDSIKLFLDDLILNNPKIKKTAWVHHAKIEDVDPKEILKKTKLKIGELDVLFGGVVCKGFSLAGVRDPNDKRNTLYLEQLRMVEFLRPKISIIENVPGMANLRITSSFTPLKIREKISKIWSQIEKYKGIKAKLTKEGVNLSKKDLLFLEATKKKKKELEKIVIDTSINVIEDIKKRYDKMGYNTFINKLNAAWYGAATKRIRLIIIAVRKDIGSTYEFPEIEYYDEDVAVKNMRDVHIKEKVKRPITVNEALKKLDLKKINNPKNDIDNRPMIHKEKTIERFGYIPEGRNIVDIMGKVPKNLKISKYYSRGCTMRLAGNKAAPTLVPGHSNFPVHPKKDRSITVREAAVITGFPLNYKFIGSHTMRCEEVGQAVPPPLAKAIAESTKKILNSYYKKNEDIYF
jgi:DNA (cytosine-5)-methyltransferase 1